ncbi:hypothetical protein K501DRAFT_265968 [Backusella circina FSU 941]|nr:hypothetical protein K501DRAFT_265968 [Backusella circina FSU 941]
MHQSLNDQVLEVSKENVGLKDVSGGRVINHHFPLSLDLIGSCDRFFVWLGLSKKMVLSGFRRELEFTYLLYAVAKFLLTVWVSYIQSSIKKIINHLQQLEQQLGFARLVKLTDRNIGNELKEPVHSAAVNDKDKLYPVGAKVVRVRHHKTNKMDSNYKPEEFVVIAAFLNRTYQLVDNNGRLLKRHVNHSNLSQINPRGNSPAQTNHPDDRNGVDHDM